MARIKSARAALMVFVSIVAGWMLGVGLWVSVEPLYNSVSRRRAEMKEHILTEAA